MLSQDPQPCDKADFTWGTPIPLSSLHSNKKLLVCEAFMSGIEKLSSRDPSN